MQAWQLDDAADPPRVVLQNIQEPAPGAGEILVRVHAAGVTPSELRWYPTTHTKAGAPRHNAVPGHEFSGVVAGLGPDVRDVAVEDEIFGMNDWFADGAVALYCITRPEWVAPKPAALSHAQAASVPISALTAWQGLFDKAKLQRGERVLIHGAAGGVGVYAVQFARRQGARVIVTAGSRSESFLRQLGIEEFIDYHAGNFQGRVRDVNVVFDTVGGATLERSWQVLAPGGRVVTIASSGSEAEGRNKQAFFIVEPNRAQLATIGGLLQSGELLPVLDAVVPFSQAGAAYAGTVTPRAGRGKVVLTVSEPE